MVFLLFPGGGQEEDDQILLQPNIIKNKCSAMEPYRGQAIKKQPFSFYVPGAVCLVAQLRATLCGLLGYSPPGSSAAGMLQARILQWVAMPFSRVSFDPAIEPGSTSLWTDSLPLEPPGKPTGTIGSI